MPPLGFESLAPLAEPATQARRAIVIGASLAGLLAARMLAGHFDEVLLLDRGELPDGNADRKATPHTRHAHGLLARGRQVLEALFPGFTEECVAQGGRLGDLQQEVMFYAGPRRFAQARAGVQGLAVSRAVIEGAVRRRVLALPGVRAFTGVEVRAPLVGAGTRRVTGVRLGSLAHPADALLLQADLVVDASGRASRLPQWLEAMGFAAPTEERVKVEIRYATAYFERNAADLPGTEVVLCAAMPDCPLPAVMIAQEGGRWVVTLGGYGADAPPLDRDGFVQRAQRVAPEIAGVVRAARFVCEPFGYRFPHSQRRRFEHLREWPEGLLAVGDAVCSFNPIYGQGMTVAACEAMALGECLAAGEARLAQRFFRRAARFVDVAWSTAVGADLAIPSVEGARPLPARLINAYVARVFEAAEHDPVVARAFLDVAHLLAEPPSLMRPAIVARVLARAWRRPQAAATAQGVRGVTRSASGAGR